MVTFSPKLDSFEASSSSPCAKVRLARRGLQGGENGGEIGDRAGRQRLTRPGHQLEHLGLQHLTKRDVARGDDHVDQGFAVFARPAR